MKFIQNLCFSYDEIKKNAVLLFCSLKEIFEIICSEKKFASTILCYNERNRSHLILIRKISNICKKHHRRVSVTVLQIMCIWEMFGCAHVLKIKRDRATKIQSFYFLTHQTNEAKSWIARSVLFASVSGFLIFHFIQRSFNEPNT